MKNLFIMLLLALPVLLFGQSAERQVIPAGGGFVSTPNVQVSYTTGEAVVLSSSPTITVGFQQGYTDSVVAILEKPGRGFSASVYPNPATSEIIIDLDLDREMLLNVKLLDLSGKLTGVGLEELTGLGKQKYRLDVSALSNGNYLLYFVNGAETLGTIKLQKVD